MFSVVPLFESIMHTVLPVMGVPLNFPLTMPLSMAGCGGVGIRVGPGDKSYPYPVLRPSRLFPSIAACSSWGELR